MVGSDFFIAVMLLGIGLLGSGGFAGLWIKQRHWSEAEEAGLRFMMEFSLAAVLLALMPFVLSYIIHSRSAVWRISSVFYSIFMFVEIGRIYFKANLLGVRRVWAAVFLLVLSVIMLTIELINLFWWGSLVGYAGGLLWLLTLAGIQFIAFVCHDRSAFSSDVQRYTVAAVGQNKPVGGAYRHHGVLGERLQRDYPAHHPYRTAHRHRHTHRNPVEHARRERHAHRLAFTRTRAGYGRTVANPTVRSNQDAVRR